VYFGSNAPAMNIGTLLVASIVFGDTIAAKHHTADQKSWPSSDTWSAFDASIGGHLVAPHPPAWPCHDPSRDDAACKDANANWNNSFWRSSQTGAMQDPSWESLNRNVDTPQNATYDQDIVSVCLVAAQDRNDVSNAIKFVGEHNSRLVVKNTGHG
jgi:hypothetical protein